MAWVNRLTGLLGGRHIKCNLVMVGLAESGKSTLMMQLKPGDCTMVHLEPTIPLCSSFHAERFHTKSLNVVAFDLGDLTGFGNPWEDFYRDSHAVIFVVDASDRLNMSQVKTHLGKVLSNPLISSRSLPVLVFANKSDQPGAVPSLQLAQILDLNVLIQSKPWFICATDALTGEGIHEGFDWLAHQLRRQFRQNESSAPLRRAVSWYE